MHLNGIVVSAYKMFSENRGCCFILYLLLVISSAVQGVEKKWINSLISFSELCLAFSLRHLLFRVDFFILPCQPNSSTTKISVLLHQNCYDAFYKNFIQVSMQSTTGLGCSEKACKSMASTQGHCLRVTLPASNYWQLQVFLNQMNSHLCAN